MSTFNRGSKNPVVTPVVLDPPQSLDPLGEQITTQHSLRHAGAGSEAVTHPTSLQGASVASTAGGAPQSVCGTFNAGILTSFGDGQANNIEFSRDAAGSILINEGAVPVQGGAPTVANTNLILAFGLGGDDVIALDEANGALPRANLFGGAGNDTLIGGSGADRLFGQAGNDTLLGKGGNDQLFGGAGNDILTGGDGDDRMLGQGGNDRMIWNPGDDSDLMEGGAGIDTAEVNGGNGGEAFTILGLDSRVLFNRVDPLPFAIDIGTTEHLVLNANGGDDTIAASGDLAGVIQLTIDGGAGNDIIQSGNGADLLFGGDGNDFIDGNQGVDTAFMGAGDDVFQWDPGDGSDVVEGGVGTDSMTFLGNGASESFEFAADGERVRMTRDVGTIVMDLNDVERTTLNTFGGIDEVVVGDLSGTDLNQIRISLIGAAGQANDGQADSVTVNGTQGDDVITVATANAETVVSGLPAEVRITGADVGLDRLQIDGGGGDDVIDASGSTALAISAFGGLGKDTLIGSDGDDFFNGGDGDDLAFMGAGDDTFVWNPGEDNDTLEGQAGFDTMRFNGNGADEKVDISANGERVLFVRNVASVTMDSNDVERIEFNALGGSDEIVVNDLSRTDVSEVAIDLAGAEGGGDGQIDLVTAIGTNGDDVAIVSGSGTDLQVVGLAAEIVISGAESANDRIIISGLAGDDVIEASGVEAGAMGLVLDGGDGDDVLIGGAGNDTILGGAGDDVLIGGPGLDVLDGGTGDNVIISGPDASFTVNNFRAGAGSQDRIDVSGLGVDFDWLMAHASDVDGNTVLDLGDHQITLRGVSTSALHQDDFLI